VSGSDEDLEKAIRVTALLMTGFPGFLGSALLPRLLARREAVRAICLVQPQHLATARRRVREIETAHPHTRDRIELMEGDITAPGLGLDPAAHDALDEVNEVWHLAAIYDLAVAHDIAQRVNVEGTAQVLAFCQSGPAVRRLQYVSTCYVSGAYDGEFPEDALDEGQAFLNHYESTKFEAEMLVRAAMAGGLPATIYRPGIVVGDSRTGETQKYDGPYFLASFMQRQLPLAVVPAVGNIDRVRVSLVPRDFVIEAMELVDFFAAHLGRRVIWLWLPLGVTRAAVGSVPGVERLLGLPAEALDYFASPTTYSTANTVSELAGTGLECPPFESYAGKLLDFMVDHPEIDSSAMV